MGTVSKGFEPRLKHKMKEVTESQKIVLFCGFCRPLKILGDTREGLDRDPRLKKILPSKDLR